MGAKYSFTLSVTYFLSWPEPPMPISSEISTSVRPVQMAAVESRPDTPGRASGSNVIMRSPSVWLFLMRLAVSSAVIEMLMALP